MLWIAECKISPGLVGGVWVVWALHSYLWLLLPIHSAQSQCLTYTLTYIAYLNKIALNDFTLKDICGKDRCCGCISTLLLAK